MTEPNKGRTPDDLAHDDQTQDDQTQADTLEELNTGQAEVRTGDADRVSEDEAGDARPADQSA